MLLRLRLRHGVVWAGAGWLLFSGAAALGAGLPLGWTTGPAEPPEEASSLDEVAPAPPAVEPSIRQSVATTARESGSAILSPFSERADAAVDSAARLRAEAPAASGMQQAKVADWMTWLGLVITLAATWAVGRMVMSLGRHR